MTPLCELWRGLAEFWKSRCGVDGLPADGLEKLKRLGFQLAAELRTGKLLLGTLPANKLEALAKLPWVTRIEKPRLR